MVAYPVTHGTGAYQLPAATLTPLALPQVGQAMRQIASEQFENNFSGLINPQRDSTFCLSAYDTGFIGLRELSLLEQYPTTYGLYQLRDVAADAIGKSVTLPAEGLFCDEENLRFYLQVETYDPQTAADATLRCIEAGYMEAHDVEQWLKYGEDAAFSLIAKVAEVLEYRMETPDYLEDVIGLTVDGQWVSIDVGDIAIFKLHLPDESDDEFAAVNVILFKTLDAMSRIFQVFQTPDTFFGTGSWQCETLAEAYECLKSEVTTSTVDELAEYLLGCDIEKLEFECWNLCDEEGFDEQTANETAHKLKEMHDIELRTGHRMDSYSVEQLRQLIHEATGHLNKTKVYADVLQALVDALEACVSRLETQDEWNEFDYAANNEEISSIWSGISIFDVICILPQWHTPYLMQHSVDAINDAASEVIHPYLRLPLGGEDMKKYTLPLIERIGDCFSLLNRITTAFEELKNARA